MRRRLGHWRRSLFGVPLLIVFSMGVTAPRPVSAQADPLVKASLTVFETSRLRDIISQFRAEAEALVPAAQESQNYSLVSAASGLRAFADNLDYVLKARQDVLFKDLNTQEQLLVSQLLALKREIEQARGGPRSLASAAVVDLDRLLDRVPVVKTQFVVLSVHGLVQLQKDGGEYTMAVISNRFGAPGQDETVAIAVVACESEANCTKAIPNRTEIRGRGAFRADLVIAAGDLAPFFAPKAMTVLRLRADITRTGRGRFGGQSTERYAFPFYVSLFPRLAAIATVKGTVSVFGWRDSPNTDPVIATHDTPNRDCRTTPGSDCRNPSMYVTTISLPAVAGGQPPRPGDKRYVFSSLECSPMGGQVAFPQPNAPERMVYVPAACDDSNVAEQDWHYTDEAHSSVVATIKTSSRPTTWSLKGVVQEWAVIDQRPFSSEIAVNYGELVEVAIPADAPAAPLMTGKSLDGRTFRVVVGEPDPASILTLISNESIPDGRRLVRYRMNPPALP